MMLMFRDSYLLCRPGLSSGFDIFRVPKGIRQSATNGWRLLKVKAMGIWSLVANWIESLLSDRKQRVVINGKCSGWSGVSSGVPQGSVLGPILFVICINDIEHGICGNILKFADYAKLFCKVGSDINCTQLRADLRKLYNWSEDWKMLFNLDKCKIMHFGYNNSNNIFLLEGHILETVDKEKDLDVMMLLVNVL